MLGNNRYVCIPSDVHFPGIIRKRINPQDIMHPITPWFFYKMVNQNTMRAINFFNAFVIVDC